MCHTRTGWSSELSLAVAIGYLPWWTKGTLCFPLVTSLGSPCHPSWIPMVAPLVTLGCMGLLVASDYIWLPIAASCCFTPWLARPCTLTRVIQLYSQYPSTHLWSLSSRDDITQSLWSPYETTFFERMSEHKWMPAVWLYH